MKNYTHPKKYMPVCLNCPAMMHISTGKMLSTLRESNLIISSQLAK